MQDSAEQQSPPDSGRSEVEQATFEKLYRNSLWEFWVSGLLWFLTLVWTVGYCYLYGYQHQPDAWIVQKGWAKVRTPDNLDMVFGFPDWIFYGVIVPWAAATVLTILYCQFLMSDDDLGSEMGAKDEL